jgi:large subunit ribosomal protein L24
MKKLFSRFWKASKQPRKPRKFQANAPLHIKKKFLSVNLSKDLRKKHERRNIPIRKGDLVKIMRGKFKGKNGKVLEVKIKKSMVSVEGIQKKKADASMVNIFLSPSNLQIIGLNLDDKKRTKKLTPIKEVKKELKTKKPMKKESKEKNAHKKT